MGFSTDAIHGERDNDERTGAVVPPLHLSTTYSQASVEAGGEYTYSRKNNPTRQHAERLIARLEGAREGIAFASGMAAITAIFSIFRQSDHFLVTNNTYSDTSRALLGLKERGALELSFVDTSNLRAVYDALRDNTRLVFLETPTNPLQKISDIEAIAKKLQGSDICLCVDNSWMTPYLQNPLDLGADIVVHSTSKYLSGHNDSIGGLVATSDAELAEQLRRIQRVNGAVLGPFDSWLLVRGVKTLSLRLDRHSENGMFIANYLSNHKLVSKVYYPGLESHPQNELARRQCRGYGGVITFEMSGVDQAVAFLNNLKLFLLAESIGGVESLACHPYTMTFGGLSVSDRERMDIKPNLVRLFAGIEDVEDLIEDIDNAFSKIP